MAGKITDVDIDFTIDVENDAFEDNLDIELKRILRNTIEAINFKENRNHYNYEWYKIEVKNCQLVLFPSWLKHGKNDDINQMDDRMVVSFNFE